MKRNVILSKNVFLLLFISMLYSCKSVNSLAKTISVESGEIPWSMTGDSSILVGVLIEYSPSLSKEEQNIINRQIKSAFKAYSGKYLLLSEYVVNYNEPDYQYIIECKIKNHFPNPPTFLFYIIDTRLEKIYYRRSDSSNFRYELKSYLKAINRVRKLPIN